MCHHVCPCSGSSHGSSSARSTGFSRVPVWPLARALRCSGGGLMPGLLGRGISGSEAIAFIETSRHNGGFKGHKCWQVLVDSAIGGIWIIGRLLVVICIIGGFVVVVLVVTKQELLAGWDAQECGVGCCSVVSWNHVFSLCLQGLGCLVASIKDSLLCFVPFCWIRSLAVCVSVLLLRSSWVRHARKRRFDQFQGFQFLHWPAGPPFCMRVGWWWTATQIQFGQVPQVSSLPGFKTSLGQHNKTRLGLHVKERLLDRAPVRMQLPRWRRVSALLAHVPVSRVRRELRFLRLRNTRNLAVSYNHQVLLSQRRLQRIRRSMLC